MAELESPLPLESVFQGLDILPVFEAAAVAVASHCPQHIPAEMENISLHAHTGETCH